MRWREIAAVAVGGLVLMLGIGALAGWKIGSPWLGVQVGLAMWCCATCLCLLPAPRRDEPPRLTPPQHSKRMAALVERRNSRRG